VIQVGGRFGKGGAKAVRTPSDV